MYRHKMQSLDEMKTDHCFWSNENNAHFKLMFSSFVKNIHFIFKLIETQALNYNFSRLVRAPSKQRSMHFQFFYINELAYRGLVSVINSFDNSKVKKTIVKHFGQLSVKQLIKMCSDTFVHKGMHQLTKGCICILYFSIKSAPCKVTLSCTLMCFHAYELAYGRLCKYRTFSPDNYNHKRQLTQGYI